MSQYFFELSQQTTADQLSQTIAQPESPLPQPWNPALATRQITNQGIIGLVIFSGFVIHFLLSKKLLRPKTLQPGSYFSTSIPCKRCRFYSRNLQLQCAVRPSEVFTTNAINCPDFSPKDSQ